MRSKFFVVALFALGVAEPSSAIAATPPVPTISAVVSGPGMMYPNPAVSLVPTAVKVEDFPYITEEYFVSGTAAGAPYQTRIIVRRPKDPKAFSGTVVAEAQHAGARSSSSGRACRSSPGIISSSRSSTAPTTWRR